LALIIKPLKTKDQTYANPTLYPGYNYVRQRIGSRRKAQNGFPKQTQKTHLVIHLELTVLFSGFVFYPQLRQWLSHVAETALALANKKASPGGRGRLGIKEGTLFISGKVSKPLPQMQFYCII
jgi:hypothetical protein